MFFLRKKSSLYGRVGWWERKGMWRIQMCDLMSGSPIDMAPILKARPFKLSPRLEIDMRGGVETLWMPKLDNSLVVGQWGSRYNEAIEDEVRGACEDLYYENPLGGIFHHWEAYRPFYGRLAWENGSWILSTTQRTFPQYNGRNADPNKDAVVSCANLVPPSLLKEFLERAGFKNVSIRNVKGAKLCIMADGMSEAVHAWYMLDFLRTMFHSGRQAGRSIAWRYWHHRLGYVLPSNPVQQ